MSDAQEKLPKASVVEAPDDVLDPEQIPAKGVTVTIQKYMGMAFRDYVYLAVGANYTDGIPIASSAVDKPVTFSVPKDALVPDANNIVLIRYDVQFYQGARVGSEDLDLLLSSGFEADAVLDLSERNYVFAFEKPPKLLPAAARMTREAQWGNAPYRYSSSDPLIASVDEVSGEVSARRNGRCTISAIDSQDASKGYSLTVKGLVVLSWLTGAADWEGMKKLCETAGCTPVTRAEIRRLWTLYYPSSGIVTEYLDWLRYSFWTSDELGADTAWVYDLSLTDEDEKESAHHKDSYCQVLGRLDPLEDTGSSGAA